MHIFKGIFNQDKHSNLRRKCPVLIRVFSNKSFENSQEDDFQIKPQRPAMDVVQIELHSLLHLVERIGFTTPTIDLCPSTNPPNPIETQHVAIHYGAILLVVRNGMWPWPHDRHTSLQHIEKLR